MEDGLSKSAIETRRTEAALVDSVEQLRGKLQLSRSTVELVNEIKATMHVELSSHRFTVIQTLYEHEREKAFNQNAAEMFPDIREEFSNGIQDFVVVRDGQTPARKTRKIAASAWKADYAADRRALDAVHSDAPRSPYRGRPEKYDPSVVWAFADAITRAAGRKRFLTGHHGDVTLAHDNKAGGPMFRALVAAIQWAMTMAWLTASPPGTEAPAVKPESILTIINRGR